MKNICSYLLISFVILLVGCSIGNTKENREITFKNEEGEVLASTSDFAKASVEQRDQDEQKIIQLTFKEEGKSEKITEPHIGETIYVYYWRRSD
ncbi:hypothetical protein SAMN05216232_3559 [Virgibacillus subterraneus]|uniref:Lipoprotein n=1 Tax=Virgibacillus subterraneus TaxID=621109 RepID=A0A1H9JNF8_9BACI|nr:hypothetical protein [Virgibacillus subterraneus]SEQ88283.1 hypothetical protein SAMN05216232_3559 [Virgibacillus subterraneus]